ncbi:hypothetical protein [Paenibacillus planticolens]|uniref:Uncharacterized protein n=1 Tax=Paenibacillus planticolens TaxID=2654976 RepID=A0ABX1ZJC1_9BACL|nr:hypothetical protein [Paenibacillus planticolens]NOV00166.1 hypothetical protein [Paenibacillus planticolens]
MWFQKKKPPPPKAQEAKPAKPMTPPPAEAAAPVRTEPVSASASSLTIQQFEKRLKKLEEELANLTAKHPQIHIDTLHVHQPVLENLTFRLDHLDIKELSGSFNLGNNFGAKPNEKKSPLDEAFKHAQVSKEPAAAASRSTRNDKPPVAAESGRDSAAPAPERTSTGYRYTPPSKTK